MINIYKFGPLDKICDPSPFCVKVEAYCRLVGIPYISQCGARFLRSAPKGKLPYIDDNGTIIADSSFIINYLRATYHDTLDDHLTLTEKAIAHAFTRMIDENLYWVLSFARWQLAPNWPILKNLFFRELPALLREIVPILARAKVTSALHKQGMGRHSETEIFEIGAQDLTALSDLLSDKTYFFGDKPCSFDAVAYSILAQFILSDSFSAPIFDKAKTYDNLVNFTQRFHQRYFLDSASHDN